MGTAQVAAAHAHPRLARHALLGLEAAGGGPLAFAVIELPPPGPAAAVSVPLDRAGRRVGTLSARVKVV